jgi:hypothetical protein
MPVLYRANNFFSVSVSYERVCLRIFFLSIKRFRATSERSTLDAFEMFFNNRFSQP